MSFDDIIERLAAEADHGDVRVSQTITGRPCLTDDRGWISAESLVDLEAVR